MYRYMCMCTWRAVLACRVVVVSVALASLSRARLLERALLSLSHTNRSVAGLSDIWYCTHVYLLPC